MRVLAVDPGYGRCGVAVLERQPGGDALLYSTCIETPATMDFPKRLEVVVLACGMLCDTHAPEALVLETLFFSKNQKTAMRVAEVRGALLTLASMRGLPVHEYSPGEVKVAVAGAGNADKAAIEKMLHVLMKLKRVRRRDDEYDAIALGVTHLARERAAHARLRTRETLQ